MPTWKRKKMLAFAAPKFTVKLPTTENLWQECPRELEELLYSEKDKPNAYELLYVNEITNLLEQSKMVAFYHTNSVDARSKRKVFF